MKREEGKKKKRGGKMRKKGEEFKTNKKKGGGSKVGELTFFLGSANNQPEQGSCTLCRYYFKKRT